MLAQAEVCLVIQLKIMGLAVLQGDSLVTTMHLQIQVPVEDCLVTTTQIQRLEERLEDCLGTKPHPQIQEVYSEAITTQT